MGSDRDRCIGVAVAEGHHHQPRIPLWDLMMKNVYSLGAFQVNRENFRLDLIYNNPTTGVDINYIPRARWTRYR
jgi:cell surface protein SprA